MMRDIEKLKPGMLAEQEGKNRSIIDKRLKPMESSEKKLDALSSTIGKGAEKKLENDSRQPRRQSNIMNIPFPELKPESALVEVTREYMEKIRGLDPKQREEALTNLGQQTLQKFDRIPSEGRDVIPSVEQAQA
ncbi:MAG: hypothetical protein V1926_03975 [Candidatus Peregrinibacteria bacterium]